MSGSRYSTFESATLVLPVLLLVHGWPTSGIDWFEIAGR